MGSVEKFTFLMFLNFSLKMQKNQAFCLEKPVHQAMCSLVMTNIFSPDLCLHVSLDESERLRRRSNRKKAAGKEKRDSRVPFKIFLIRILPLSLECFLHWKSSFLSEQPENVPFLENSLILENSKYIDPALSRNLYQMTSRDFL